MKRSHSSADSTTKKLDFIGLIVSIVGGVAAFFLGHYLFGKLRTELWIPLVIGLYFLLMGIILLGVMKLSTAINGDPKPRAKDQRNALLLILLMFALGTAFEFLYELNPSAKAGKPTSYIFLIDDSDSMSWNDPENRRSEGIEAMLDMCKDKFPVALYSFNHNCSRLMDITEAQNARKAISSVPFNSTGGTDIVSALDMVIKDIRNGTVDGGKSPRILLFSDGESDDSQLNSVLKKANDESISISVISLGGYGEAMLRKIADDTKGAYVMIDDISKLSGALDTAATTVRKVQRNLLELRPKAGLEWMYFIMRVLFLAVLGFVMMIIKSLLARTNTEENSFPMGAYLAFIGLGALAMEIGINLLRLPMRFMQLLMCVCFMLLLILRSPVKFDDGSEFEDRRGKDHSTGRFGETDDDFGGPDDDLEDSDDDW